MPSQIAWEISFSKPTNRKNLIFSFYLSAGSDLPDGIVLALEA